ncbi:hypothetical protein ACFQY0_06890 [Haloferula chungangensis]|uniref:CBM-cenC domain-containing protein n=1 Tax=Haloferula chungangensis TaxID=1048331 RepID=A0ABW2L3J7_9BACT
MKLISLLLGSLLGTAASQNLIINGDFEAGDSGFSSQYLSTTNLTPAETYAVLSNPRTGNGAFSAIGDHTTGTGLMLVVNGSTRDDSPHAWSQTVETRTQTDYVFSLWVSNVFGSSPGEFFVRINGSQLGDAIEVPAELGKWTPIERVWSSEDDASATIEIVFTSRAFGGNDTALDDFSFVSLPGSAPCLPDDPALADLSELHAEVIVPGNANPFLAGQADGASTKGDSVPQQSPVLASEVAPGDILSFSATGSVSFGGASNPTTLPDGSGLYSSSSALGIAGYSGANSLPVDALVGVFLSDAIPANPAPDEFVYPPEARNFEVLAPGLRQIFFIGDGVNDAGTRQQFVVPPGATRLFLGSSDGFGWYNNSGEFEVSICRLSSSIFGPRLGPTTIRFDQPSYTIDLGEEVSGNLVMEPIPEGGLYSQGMTVTLRSRDGTLAGLITPQAAALLDSDGPLLNAQGVNSAATGTAGIKGSGFFSQDRTVSINPVLSNFRATDLSPGTYDLAIEPWNELGPTEDIFVTGLCLTLDPYITFGTATIEVIGTLLPEITISGQITVQKQTGLLEQRLTLVNNSGRVLNGFRLFVDDLPEGVILWNAHGEIDGVPYVDYFGEIAAGATFELLLEFYRPSRDPNFTPSFRLGPVDSLPPQPSTNPLQLDLRVVRKTASGIIVEFLTEKDQNYTIEYSSDMHHWNVSMPPIIGTGERIQWLDQGPPKTESVPTDSRFYRVTNTPAP